MLKPPSQLYAISCLVALTVTALSVVKMLYYYGPISLEADPYDRYTVFAESILHGTLQTGIFDHQFPEGMDPYEPNGRQGVFWWDFSYYKGKQYHYASFLPALLFNIPFKALFGFYPGPKLQVLFSTFLAVFSVSALVLRFLEICVVDRSSCRSSSFRWIIFLFCLSGSGILLPVGDNGAYTIPAFHGLAFLSLALFCLLAACQRNDLAAWTAASALYALAVVSRPPLLFYGPVFLVSGFAFSAASDKRKALAIFVSAALVCAIILGTINYLRFENPLEFGNRYQLNEFNNYKYPFVPNSLDLLKQRLPRGLWFHLLNRPRIFSHLEIALFPYYIPPWLQSSVCSPMGGDGMIGTLILLPSLVFLIPLAVRKTLRADSWPSRFSLVLLLCSVWVLLFAASLIWVADRYALDYRLYMTLSAMAGASGVAAWIGNGGIPEKGKKVAVYIGVGGSFVISIAGLIAPYHG